MWRAARSRSDASPWLHWIDIIGTLVPPAVACALAYAITASALLCTITAVFSCTLAVLNKVRSAHVSSAIIGQFLMAYETETHGRTNAALLWLSKKSGRPR